MNIDGHKLNYHPARVAEWLKNQYNTYPIYIEITPTNACNHSCVFCALDYCVKERKQYLKPERVFTLLDEFSVSGIKSILYAGAGEPFMHKDIVKIINYTNDKGIDAAINTNMALFTSDKVKDCLKSLTWLRASINAGTKENYAEIHKTNETDFEKVLNNLEFAVKHKRDNNFRATIGTQFLLLDKNMNELIKIAQILKKIGVDYFSVKPFNPHPMSSNTCSTDTINEELINQFNAQLADLNSDNFKILFRKDSFLKIINARREYEKCYGLDFITFIREDGEVYSCIPVYGNQEYSYGNIYKTNFKEIWMGDRRKKVIERINLDFENTKKTVCRPTCRLDNINQYLWQLKNPIEHVNFI